MKGGIDEVFVGDDYYHPRKSDPNIEFSRFL